MQQLARHQEWDSGRREAADAHAPFVRGHLYHAFLSYSHRDEAVADWLHDRLERFRVPSSLVGRATEHGQIPARLTPIFRDRRELAAAGDLGNEIREALASSRFLIVLCSPTAALSQWTNREIEDFKRLRPSGVVLAAIVEGEPFASEIQGREAEECLPPALRTRYDGEGRATGERAEPLAADLRAHRDGRRLGFLKIVAGLLGVGLDDLVQRESIRRQRRLAFLAAGSLAGMAVTSGLAITAINARDAAQEQRGQAESLVGFMLGDLRTRLEPLGRLDVLDAVGARALEYYERQDKESLSDEALAQRSRALTLMGEIANQRGDLDGALRHYREALAGTAEALKRAPDDAQRIFDHAQNVFYVGSIARQRGRSEEALGAFRTYKSLAARLVALDPAKPEWRVEGVYADTNLGALLIEQGEYREAAAALQPALAEIEALVASAPANAGYVVQLGETLAFLSQAYERSGRLDDALAQRERQLALLQQEAASGDNANVKLRTAIAHRAIGRLLASRGDHVDGMRHLTTATRSWDELIRTEPGNTVWAQLGAETHLERGEMQLALGDRPAASLSARTGCDIAGRLVERDPTVIAWRTGLRASCLRLRARLALARGGGDEAEAIAAQLVPIVRAEAARAANPDSKFVLAAALALAGDVHQAAGRTDAARRAWADAIAAMPQRAEESPRHSAERATLLARLGRQREAAAIQHRLAAIGYRHPEYLATLAATRA